MAVPTESPAGAAAACFTLLCAASVTMTLGNKLLMVGELVQHKDLVVCLQNCVAASVLLLLTAIGQVEIRPLDRKQLIFYSWDAVVLVFQLYTSFASLQYLPVAATTVVRALAIPVVAWCEWLVLGTRLQPAQHVCSWVVVLGAALYAREDLLASSSSAVGYLWAGANLIAYVSNSVLDRLVMSTSDQTASGLTLYTQALSVPICYVQGALLHGLTPQTAVHMLQTLDLRNSLALVVTGVGAALLGRCYAQCYQIASATAVTIAGNVNKAVSVLASVAILGDALSPTQLIGMLACLGGAMGYSLLRAQPAVQPSGAAHSVTKPLKGGSAAKARRASAGAAPKTVTKPPSPRARRRSPSPAPSRPSRSPRRSKAS